MNDIISQWDAMSGEEQAELANRAARRAVQIARSYGAELSADELWGETWEGIVTRLNADYLDKHNARREQPLTLWQIAFRAAHAAAEVWRYDRDKHGNSVPLEDWNGVNGYDVERCTINRIAIDDYLNGLDSRGKAIMELTAQGFTERQTGEAVGISGAGVHKRIAKMRAALAEALN